MDHKHDQTPAPWRVFPFAGTVLKNLFSKPATTGYPFEPAHYPERMRGHVEIAVEDCISCGLCARNCPQQCIEEGTPYMIRQEHCLHCGLCAENCPVQAIAKREGRQC